MKFDPKRTNYPSAFTLVELLVTISIVVVLASIAFSLTQKAKQAAEKASCLSRLRQVGTILAGRAGETNNRYEVFRGGAGSFELRPYFILRDELGLPKGPYPAHFATLGEIMFCPAAPEPNLGHWNCFGIHVSNTDRAGSQWKTETIRDQQGRIANAAILRTSLVKYPSQCVLVADSCRSDGQQIFRIQGGDLIGLRHQGKASALFLDGSARTMSKADLGQLGFKKAYDTSVNPPSIVTLPKTR